MTQAWNTTPITRDEDMPLGVGFNFPRMDAERDKYVEAVRRQLQYPPLRWTKERLIPWLMDHTNPTSSHRS